MSQIVELPLKPPHSAEASRPIAPWQWLLLIFIVAAAAAIRINRLGVPGFWFDEVATVSLAAGHWRNLFFHDLGYFPVPPAYASAKGLLPVWDVLTESDSHPPLYVLLLRGWWTVFGMSETSLRMFSVVMSLIAIAIVFDLSRLLAGPGVGLWAAALMAASPTQLRYAQEARSYALLVMFGAALCDAVLRLYLYGPNRRRWIAIALLAVLTACTHYFAAGAVAGVMLFAWLRLNGRMRWTLIGIIAAAFLVLFASRLPIVLTHMNATQSSVHYLDEDRQGLIGRTLGRVATIPMWLIVAPRDTAMVTGAPGALLLILPFVLDRRRPGLVLCGIWSCGAIGLVAASDVVLGHNALTYVRYTIAATPGVVVALVVVCDLGGKWVRHTLPALAVLGGLTGISSVYSDEIWEKTESRQWALEIRSQLTPDDVLVVYSKPDMGLYSAGQEYLYIDYYASPLPCPVDILEGPPTPEDLAKIWSHRRVWVAVCYYSSPGDVLGPSHIVSEGRNYYGAGKVLLLERDNPTAQRSASRHST